MAIQANEGNKAVIVQMKAASVRRSAKERRRPRSNWPSSLRRVSVSFTRRTGENDQLFGSVTSSDIGEALTKKGFNIDRRKIQLHEPLKSVGEFIIPVKLHKDVTTHLKVIIEKEAARGVIRVSEFQPALVLLDPALSPGE